MTTANATIPFTKKYRPKSLADMAGQKKLKSGLGAILRTGRVPGAIGLLGASSAGKTTSARIVARSLMCLESKNGDACGTCLSCVAFDKRHSDYAEVNAAKERGIDAMKALASQIVMRPSLSPFRVVVLDEAHKITNDAWNALLKVLEEPPEHVIFIVATTDPQKLPDAILNRLTNFTLENLTVDECVEVLERIYKAEDMEKEGVTVDDLRTLAIHTRCVPRAAIHALDQLYTMVVDNNVMKGDIDRSAIASFVREATTNDVEVDASIIIKGILVGKSTKNSFTVLEKYATDSTMLLHHLWVLSKAALIFCLDPDFFASQQHYAPYLPMLQAKSGAPLSVFGHPSSANVLLTMHDRFTRAIKESGDYTIPADKVVTAAVVEAFLAVKNQKSAPAPAAVEAPSAPSAPAAPSDDPMAALNPKNHKTKP